MNKAMDTVNELKNAIDHIQEIVENYIRKSPIHDLVHDQIEMVKRLKFNNYTFAYNNFFCSLKRTLTKRDYVKKSITI